MKGGAYMRKILIYFLVSIILLQCSSIFASPFGDDPFGPVEKEKETSSTNRAAVKNVTIKTNKDKIDLSGNTSGFTDNMTIIIKIINKKGELLYFNDLAIKRNSFSASFSLSDIHEGEDLMLKISGDLIYTKEFAFGEDNKEDIGDINDTALLDSYLKNELGSFIDYNGEMLFSHEYNLTGKDIIITLKGENFADTDKVWRERTQSRWLSYLEIIADKAISLYQVPVTIRVFDNKFTPIDFYTKVLTEGHGFGIKEIKDLLNRDFRTFSDKKHSLRFAYEVSEGLRTINIDMNGYFLKKDYDLIDKQMFLGFLENMYNTLEPYIYKDVNIVLHDQVGNIILSREFYNKNGPTQENKIYEYFETLQQVINSMKQEGFVVSEKDLVRMLDYGKNSYYVPNESLSVSNNGVDAQISITNIANVASRVPLNGNLVIKYPESAEGYRFFASNDLALNLINKKAKLIFVVPKGEIYLDFSKSSTPFNIEIGIHDTDDPYSLVFKADSFAPMMKNGIEGLIRYDIGKVSIINDTRTLNVFYNNQSNGKDLLLDSKTLIDKQGIKFKYSEGGKYSIRDNGKYFEDTNNHWGNTTVNIVSAKDIIVGIGDNMYAPEKTITRAEFIAMIMRNLRLDKPFSGSNAFKDVSTKDWYYSVVNAGKAQKILPPTFEGNLSPNKPITREEMIFITMACYDLNPELENIGDSAIFFKDKAKISEWAKSSISRATELKIIKGYQNEVMPKDTATRTEAAAMMIQLLRLQKNI